jgi:alpha-D-ribose 1-methylphosphonate 5-triphosphate synthase subunit PhnH
MALKIQLKPHERVVIAGASICNGPTAASFLVENNAPILREKDILKEKEALSPAQKIYFVIQVMYLDSGQPDGPTQALLGARPVLRPGGPQLAQSDRRDQRAPPRLALLTGRSRQPGN